MTIWEFRRLVRARRCYFDAGFCPLGTAIMQGCMRNPMPVDASRRLGLDRVYCFGVVAGFDQPELPPIDLLSSPEFDAGERFGRRMRKIAQIVAHREIAP